MTLPPKKHDYDNAAQRRTVRLLLALAGHELHGLAPKELSDHLQVSAATITRDLHNLVAEGVVTRIEETGRYRLGPKLVQVAMAHLTAMDRAEHTLNEIKNRYTRQP